MARRHKRHRRSRGRRRHNPILGGRLSGAGDTMSLALWAVAGGAATRVVPQALLKSGNSGVMGYGANVLTGFVASFLARRFGGPSAGKGVLVGSFVAVVQRAIADFLGPNASSYGLSGDLDFDLGFYLPNSFPLPTTGSGPYLLQPGQSGLPQMAGGIPGMAISPISTGPGGAQAPVAAIAPGVPGDEPGRWGNRWAS